MPEKLRKTGNASCFISTVASYISYHAPVLWLRAQPRLGASELTFNAHALFRVRARADRIALSMCHVTAGVASSAAEKGRGLGSRLLSDAAEKSPLCLVTIEP